MQIQKFVSDKIGMYIYIYIYICFVCVFLFVCLRPSFLPSFYGGMHQGIGQRCYDVEVIVDFTSAKFFHQSFLHHDSPPKTNC